MISVEEQEKSVFMMKLPQNNRVLCFSFCLRHYVNFKQESESKLLFAMYYNFLEFSLFGDKKFTLTCNKNKKNYPETLKFVIDI